MAERPSIPSFGDAYRNEKVMITGHTGFKGSWLSAWLLQLGAEVFGFSKDIPATPPVFDRASLSNHINHQIGDIRDLTALTSAIRSFRPKYVFHLAAQAIVSVAYQDPVETITTNVIGTVNILESLRVVDWPCAAVIVTSDKCYDNQEWVWGYRETDRLGGKDIYSGSKGAAELLFNSYWQSFFGGSGAAVRLATVRAGNVIGGGDWATDRIVTDCIRAWSKDARVQIRSPAATRPWQHALEPLSGYLTLATHLIQNKKFDGQPYNFGPRGEQNRTVVQMIGDLATEWGLPSTDRGYEIIDNLPFHEASLLKLNCDKALIDLGWETNLNYAECVEFTGQWYRRVLREDHSALECTIQQINRYEAIARERRRVWTEGLAA